MRQTVLFRRTQRPRGKWVLFVVPAAGGESRRLIKQVIPVSATRASWSKQGQIAFTGGTRNRQQQLWLVESDGSNPRHVAIDGLSTKVFYPSWYPDGSKLAVLDAGSRLLQQVDLERKSVKALTKESEFLVGMPSVSPNVVGVNHSVPSCCLMRECYHLPTGP